MKKNTDWLNSRFTIDDKGIHSKFNDNDSEKGEEE